MQRLSTYITFNFLAVSNSRKLFWLGQILVAVLSFFLSRLPTVRAVLPAELIQLLLVVISANIILATIKVFAISSYRKRNKLDGTDKDNFTLAIEAVANLFLVIVVLASLFPIFDIPLIPFITSVGLFSVALSWLFKEYVTNYIDSFRLMFSPDFRIGDYIKVNDTAKGVITDITLRATKMKTDEGDVLMIPNTTLMNTEVINFSKVQFKRVRILFQIKNSFLGDVSALEEHLKRIATGVIGSEIDSNRAFLRLAAVTAEHTECVFEISIDEYSFSIEDKLQRAINKAVIDWQYKK